MKNIPKISDAELSVMKVLWERSPLTANGVVDLLTAETDWNHRTIRTLLARLVKKGALATEQQGREYLFSPIVSRDQVFQVERQTFIQRLYNGSVLPMLTAFLEEEELSEEEINKLKDILKRREEA